MARNSKHCLVVQWLRLREPKKGAQVQSPVRELDPTCCNRVCMLQLPKAPNNQINKLKEPPKNESL